MSIIQGNAHPEEGYNSSRSLRFNSADSAYLNRTPASAGNRKTWTWSGWVKRSVISTNQYLFSAFNTTNQNQTNIQFGGNVTDDITVFSNTGGVQQAFIASTAVHRDVSSWYHVVVAWDTTQVTASNRIKIYINGTQVTALSQSSYPSQNYDGHINTAAGHAIGAAPTPSSLFNGYLTETYFIDGQALTPSSFGETDPITGVWRPKKYTGTYGTNGFILTFEDNSGTTSTTLGKDYSGNGNNWTPNNFSVTAGAGNDSLVDVPTRYGTDTGAGGEVRGNYATLNPIDKDPDVTLANGNLDYSQGTAAGGVRATIGMTSGKWYWEATVTAVGMILGVSTAAATIGGYTGADANGWGFANSGDKFNNGTGTAYGASTTVGDVIGVAFDADAGTLVFYKNGVSQGTAFSGLTSGPYFPSIGRGSTTPSASFNFGQRPFAYTAPSGFKALCTTNLPTPTIGATSTTQANKYFDATVYSGNSSTQTITNSGSMQPDFVWIKDRTQAFSNYVQDAVRGVDKYLITNATNAEATLANSVTSFNSNGFSLGNNAAYNGTGDSYVAWQWNAGGSTVTNTSGSISAQVRANTTAGFSVVTYTGTGSNATVGHGLGVAPKMIIVKSRSNTSDWIVYHSSLSSAAYRLFLNATNAQDLSTTTWNSTAPTSTVFSLGTNANVNTSTWTQVAYCFAPVEGFSAFGSYTGNGSADGPFVYCGFRPRYVLFKASGLDESWYVYDSARNTYNVVDLELNPNNSGAEQTFTTLDFVSNGFKIRTTNSLANTNGATYIFAAFAEFPQKYSLGR